MWQRRTGGQAKGRKEEPLDWRVRGAGVNAEIDSGYNVRTALPDCNLVAGTLGVP
jgi:hypothetical protein